MSRNSIVELLNVSFCSLQRVSAFTRAKATVVAKPGGKFSMLGGNITGEFVELIPERKIVQKWRFSSWPEGKMFEKDVLYALSNFFLNCMFSHFCTLPP